MFFFFAVNLPGGGRTFVRVQAPDAATAQRRVLEQVETGSDAILLDQAESEAELSQSLQNVFPDGNIPPFQTLQVAGEEPSGGDQTFQGALTGEAGRQFEQLFPEQTIRSAISPNIGLGGGGVFRRAVQQRTGDIGNILGLATAEPALAQGGIGGLNVVGQQGGVPSIPNLIGQIGGGGAQGVGQTARELIEELAGVSERTNPLAGLSDPEQEILRRRLFQAAITGASPGGGFVASRLRGAFQPFQERFAQNLQTDLTQTGAGETFAQFLRRRILGG